MTKLDIAYKVIKEEEKRLLQKAHEDLTDTNSFYQALGLSYALGVLEASFKKLNK